MHMMNMMGMAGFGMIGMLLYMIVFILLIVGIIWVVIRLINKMEQPVSDNSINILNERFAKGEIDEEEYSRKKGLLSKK